MKVLVIDDDQDQLSLRSMLIEKGGFEAIQASSGSSAMEIAAKTQPSCAVMDLRIPTEAAGLQLIRELKNLDSSMHVIVLTGADPSGFRKHPESLLIDELLVKPTSTSALIQKLRRFDLANRG